MQVFAFLETSHLFNGSSWPLTTIEVGRWQESSGREVCMYLARGGHGASLEHACLNNVLWKEKSRLYKVMTKFRTPAAVGAAFCGAAEGGHLACVSRLRQRYSWEFCQASWSVRGQNLLCKAAAESGSMELLEWMDHTMEVDGLPWNWRWVHVAAPDLGVGD